MIFYLRQFRFAAVGLALSLGWLRLLADAPLTVALSTPQPLKLGEAVWTDGFFYDRFELCRTQMVPSMGRLMAGTNYTQFLRNFEIAAGLVAGKARGASFNDGDFYKWLEAASATLAVTNDPALHAQLDRIIGIIAQAQRPDGYLDTAVQIRAGGGDTNAIALTDPLKFETYNLGHLFTAACIHHQVTGQSNFLAVAIKAANYLGQAFAQPTPGLAACAICPAHYQGLLDLWQETGDAAYLTLAQQAFALWGLIQDGGDDNQDRVPFARQTEAQGHAVRANYLYTGAAELYRATHETDLWPPLTTIWTNVVSRKLYLTGGCGALYDGASPAGARDQKTITRVHQAYGANYELPNTTAHNETCANIGNALWNWQMFLASGEPRYLDVVEQELYNAIPAGGALDGTNFFYTNPLRVTDPMPEELRWSRTRVPFVSTFCCPPNLARTYAETARYAYAKNTNTLWVNLYGENDLHTELGGQVFTLRQTTAYPWEGRVTLKIVAGQGAFRLILRIPAWASSARVQVNHESPHKPQPGTAYAMDRTWQPGDVIQMDLPLKPVWLEANPLVEATVNQVALRRGPVVYCLESPDLPPGVHITDVAVRPEANWRARFDGRLLAGITVVEGNVQVKAAKPWSGALYREAKNPDYESTRVRFIPYAVWQNRGPAEMTVWLPRTD
ncbi:MAG TPA: beta-L-arabinofuranosidase domain-containing protein [Verrucomicrobiae bacterium]